jgi:hypothetical protein
MTRARFGGGCRLSGQRRSHSSTLALLAVVLAGLVATVFGLQSARAAGVARVKCKAPALTTAPKLPAGFPKPPEVTYTSAVQAGPTLIVHGYFAAGLDDALNEYKAAVSRARYTNLKTEHDPHDAEVNYAGGGTTGQIALRDVCREADTTSIQITSRPNSPSTTKPASLPSWFTKLRTAVNSLVRETSLGDKDGSTRAFAALDKTFAGEKARLRVKAPDETAAITMWIEKADASLRAGSLVKAHTYAVNMTKELSDAATKIAGAPAATPTGLAGVLASLKATAGDLDQEASFHDSAGTKRELAAFTKLFTAHRVQIKAKSPKAAALIASALARVSSEVTAGDKAGIRTATEALIAAVNRATTLVGN